MSFPPAGDDELHTTEILARALEEQGDQGLADLVVRARAGEFHDFLSPHAMPERVLAGELRKVGYPDLVARVVNGDFDASPAESMAWRQSREGAEIIAAATAGKLGGFIQDVVRGKVNPSDLFGSQMNRAARRNAKRKRGGGGHH